MAARMQLECGFQEVERHTFAGGGQDRKKANMNAEVHSMMNCGPETLLET